MGLAAGVLRRFDFDGVLVAESVIFSCGVVGLARRPHSLGTVLRGCRTRCSGWRGGIAAALVGLALSMLLSVIKRAIVDYDSLAYHLPAVAHWVQVRSILPLEGLPHRYPFTWELIAGLFVLPFREDFLISFPNWLAWVLFGVAIVSVARDVGAGSESAVVAALLVLSMPALRGHVLSLHVDLAMAAFFMAGLHFALAWDGSRRVERALLLAAASLTASVKTSGLIYAGLLLPVVLVSRGSRQGANAGRDHIRVDPQTGALTLEIAAIVVGVFWYAGLVMQGTNPIGDLELRVGGLTLLPGTRRGTDIARTTLLGLFEPGNREHWSILFGVLKHELGLPLAFLFGMMLVFGPRLLHGAGAGSRRLAVGALTMATALAYAATPFSAGNENHHQFSPWMREGLRYAFPLVGLIGVWGAVALDRAGRSRLVLIMLAIVIAVGEMRDHLNRGILLALIIWAPWGLAPRGMTCSRAWATVRGAVAASVAVAVVLVTWRAREHHGWDRTKQYNGVQEFVAGTISPDDILGYAFTREPYILYGKNLRQSVIEVPLAQAGREAWLDELRRQSVALLAIGPIVPQWRSRPEIEWVLDRDGPFTRVYGEFPEKEIVLFGLRKTAN